MERSNRLRPNTWLGFGVLILSTVGAVIYLRVLLGDYWFGPPAKITYVGTLGGGVAGLVMVSVLEWRTNVDSSTLPRFRVIQWLHVTYFTIGGGLYPFMMNLVVGLSSQWYGAVPGAILTAVVWSEFLFVVAAVVYWLGGAISASLRMLNEWLDMFWFYLVYGVVLGIIVGLSETVWLPAFG